MNSVSAYAFFTAPPLKTGLSANGTANTPTTCLCANYEDISSWYADKHHIGLRCGLSIGKSKNPKKKGSMILPLLTNGVYVLS